MADPRETLKAFGVLPGQPPVEQAGGGITELELRPITPETTLDADYAEMKAEAAANAARAEEQAAALAAGPTPQSDLFPAPSKPSAVAKGMEAGGRAAGEGVRAIVDGLRALVGAGPSTATASVLNLPQPEAGKPVPNSIEAMKKILLEGVMQLGLSPLTAAFGAAGQGLENLSPEVANATVADGFAAAGVRGLLSGKAFKALSPEEQQAALAPLTVREFLESVGPLAALGAKGAVKKVGLAAEIQRPNLRSERGAIGQPPVPSEFRGQPGAGGPGEPPGAGPRPAAGAGGPSGERVTLGESRLNVERMNVAEDVKRVAARVNAIQAEKLAESRRTRPHGETISEGEALHLTVEQALALDPLTVPVAEARKTQQALRDLHASAVTHLAEIGKRVTQGEAGLDAAGWAAFDLAGELSVKQEVIGTEAGRTIEARKIGAEAARAVFDPEAFTRLREQTAGVPRGDFSIMARRLAALPGGTQGVQARSFIRQTWEMFKLGKDMAHELWINWLLTNPVTHAANVMGTGGTTLWELPERATAEILHRLFSDSPDGVQRGETAAMLRSGLGALRDGFRLAGKAMQAEADLSPAEREMLGRTRIEFTRQLSAANVAERMGWNPETTWGKALDTLGATVNAPVTGLAIEDAFWKGVNYRLELSALAVREARAEGLTGEAYRQRVRELEVNPNAIMMTEAVNAAMVRTLNAKLGPAGQLFMQWANKVPGGRVVAPFIQTPVDSVKWFGQRAPILAQLSAKNWSDMMAGGAAREMAIARQAVGAAFTAVIAYEVFQGNITGGGPTDKGLRKLQRDPNTATKPVYSFKVGDDYYNLSRIDPMFGTFVGAIADYIELASQIPTQDAYDEWAAYGEALMIASGHLLINKTWAQSAAALLDAIQDPDRNFGKVRQSYARSIVPAGVRQFTRTQMDENIVREVRGITDAIKSGLPYFVNQVPVDRNPITGEAVEYPPGWGPDMVSPITVTQKSDSLVFQEIQTNKIHLSPVPRALGGTEIEGPLMTEQRPGPPIPLSPEQRDYWRLAMTQHVKRNGMNLYEALDDLVHSERYQRLATGPGGGRELLFKTIYRGYKQAGFKMLYDASPQIREAFRAQKEARGAALLPVTDPRSPQYGLSQSLGR